MSQATEEFAPDQDDADVNHRSAFRRFVTSPIGIGVVALVLTAVIAFVMFEKDMLLTRFGPGETVTVHFARDYQLRASVTPVKVGGVKVGRVASVERQPDGSAMVDLTVDHGIPQKIGTMPSAAIRPTIILGGNYYLELIPGGDHDRPFSGVIPPERATTPVELDQVASVFQPDAIKGVRTATDKLDDSLGGGAKDALQGLVTDAPAALAPSADVLKGLTGTTGGDLTAVVGGLEQSSRVLTDQPGQLDSITHDLALTSTALGHQARAVGDTFARMPQTLDAADSGLARLHTTLDKLKDTAGPARPTVRQLDTLVDHGTPVLQRTAPVVANLNQVLHDLHPVVDELVPTSQRATSVLDDVKSPVIDRINGPITNTILSPYVGTGHYNGTGGDGKTFYQELGPMVAGIDRASKLNDQNGSNVGFQPGFGAGSIEGTPINLEQLVQGLLNPPNPEVAGAGR